jgi:hypothetical protein
MTVSVERRRVSLYSVCPQSAPNRWPFPSLAYKTAGDNIYKRDEDDYTPAKKNKKNIEKNPPQIPEFSVAQKERQIQDRAKKGRNHQGYPKNYGKS